MIACLVLLLIIAIPCAFAAVKWDKSANYSIPITIMGISFLLLFVGIIISLKAGLVTILALEVLMLIAGITIVIRKEDKKSLLLRLKVNLVTTGSIFYAIAFLVFIILEYGVVAEHMDEFSHWVYAVKTMSMVDDFCTNPATKSWFASYPPIMALFQYFLQKIHWLMIGKSVFCEWLAFFAFQAFALSIPLPFFPLAKEKKVAGIIMLIAIVILLPLAFNLDYYRVVLVDAFIGVLSGYGMAAVVLLKRDKKTIEYVIYECFIMATLVMVKDAGLLFAIFLCVLFILDLWINSAKNDLFTMKRVACSAAAIASILLPKLMWNWEIAKSETVRSFSNPVKIGELIHLNTPGFEYRKEVLKSYVKVLVEPSFTIGATSIKISYISLTILLLTVFVMTAIYLYEKRVISYGRSLAALIVCVVLLLGIYVVGLCVMYMFKFTAEEALQLACKERYLSIGYLSVGLLTAVMLYRALLLCTNSVIYKQIGFVAAIILLIPMGAAVAFFSRMNVRFSNETRSNYSKIVSNVERNCPDDSKTFIISEITPDYDSCVLRFLTYDNPIDYGSTPEDSTHREWLNELCNNYDYIAIGGVGEDFIEECKDIFYDEDNASQQHLYKVDKSTQKLELIE